MRLAGSDDADVPDIHVAFFLVAELSGSAGLVKETAPARRGCSGCCRPRCGMGPECRVTCVVMCRCTSPIPGAVLVVDETGDLKSDLGSQCQLF